MDHLPERLKYKLAPATPQTRNGCKVLGLAPLVSSCFFYMLWILRLNPITGQKLNINAMYIGSLISTMCFVCGCIFMYIYTCRPHALG